MDIEKECIEKDRLNIRSLFNFKKRVSYRKALIEQFHSELVRRAKNKGERYIVSAHYEVEFGIGIEEKQR